MTKFKFEAYMTNDTGERIRWCRSRTREGAMKIVMRWYNDVTTPLSVLPNEVISEEKLESAKRMLDTLEIVEVE